MVRETLQENQSSRNDEFTERAASYLNAKGICEAAESGDAERVQEIATTRPDLATANHPAASGRQRN